MAKRRKVLEYQGDARHMEYFDARAAQAFGCSCGWKGPFDELAIEPFAELCEAWCPRCETMIALVSYLTPADVRRAATRGDAEARQDLRDLEAAEAFSRRYKALALAAADQLPELEGDELRFAWVVFERDGQSFVSLQQMPSGREIWRELEAWENWEHFLEVRELLRARYGSRYRGLAVHPHAWLYLGGDSMAGLLAVKDAVKEDGMADAIVSGTAVAEGSASETARSEGAEAPRAVDRSAAARKAAATRKRKVAGRKAAATKRRKTGARKAATARKRAAAGKKAAVTRRRKAAARKAAATRKARAAKR